MEAVMDGQLLQHKKDFSTLSCHWFSWKKNKKNNPSCLSQSDLLRFERCFFWPQIQPQLYAKKWRNLQAVNLNKNESFLKSYTTCRKSMLWCWTVLMPQKKNPEQHGFHWSPRVLLSQKLCRSNAPCCNQCLSSLKQEWNGDIIPRKRSVDKYPRGFSESVSVLEGHFAWLLLVKLWSKIIGRDITWMLKHLPPTEHGWNS